MAYPPYPIYYLIYDILKADFKAALILTLAENNYPPVPIDEIFKEIFEQAENFKNLPVNK